MLRLLIILALVGVYLCEDVKQFSASVTTAHGRLIGIVQNTLNGRQIYSFLGVRYAEPPIGANRFQPPVPLKVFNGVYNATKDGPACPQPDFRPVDEDCLFINVHTPKLPKHGKNPKLPVIVYVHPGSLTTLTGNSAYVGPQYLLDRNIILVTFNYRLGSLGFLSTGDKHAPGNNGVKDQVQALRWVKENIAAFGGNPQLVTLAGYSAGGVTVALHMVSPMSKGLFQRAVIMSGSGLANVIPRTQQFELAQKQARFVGCPEGTSANILRCLMNVSATVMGDTLPQFRIFGNDPQFIWQPVIEPDFGQERFLIEDPLVSLQCGRIENVPVMTGITADELIFLADPAVSNSSWLEVLNRDWNKIAPYAFYYDEASPKADYISTELRKFYFGNESITKDSFVRLGELYSDGLSGYAINKGGRLLSTYLSRYLKVYYYIFTFKGRYTNYPPGLNKYVVHFDDMLYVFWNSLQFPLFDRNGPEARVSRKVTKLWANFAKTGKPILERTADLDWVKWTSLTDENKKYLDIGTKLTMKKNIYLERYKKWEELFPLPNARCKV